ncbi:MAG: DUF58 domain-containing protein [Xanthobacteraceae bacterium]
MTDNAQNDALVSPFSALVRSRPDRRTTGFAPGGKVRTHQFGTNRSVFRGRGMEFDEARIYQPGDDARSIDWRVTARTGKMHTKLFHEERERPVLILADLRASMHFGTRTQFKSVLAATIAAELAWVGIDGGDRVGGFILLPNGVRSFPATRNISAMLRLLKALSDGTQPVDEPDGEAEERPLHAAVDRLRQVSRPGTLVFIVSDFADFDERTERAIKRLSLHAHVTNVLVYDQLDEMLPHGNQRISDGDHVTLLAALGRGAIEDHARSFRDRRDRLERICRQRGMSFLAIPTAASARDVLAPHRKGAAARNRRERIVA